MTEKDFQSDIVFETATLTGNPVVSCSLPPLGAGERKGAGEAGHGGARSAPLPPAAMLDIPTPPDDHELQSLHRRMLGKTSRRLFSRIMLGLTLPAVYWFCTWTTTKERPLTENDWRVLRRWLQRSFPGCCWIYCITGEGNGVIHMVLRLKKGNRFSIKKSRAYWTNLTGAKQMSFLPVKKPKDLAAYMADQRKKKRLAGEFAWQDFLKRWRWSKGWLPRGFTRSFGRAYVDWLQIEEWARKSALDGWLLRCFDDPSQVTRRPTVREAERRACGEVPA
jgi:hypothetical protein